MLGLIGAALGAGRALYGAIAGNQTKQKNKGLISQALRENQLQQDLGQADIRQGTNESLNEIGRAHV